MQSEESAQLVPVPPLPTFVPQKKEVGSCHFGLTSFFFGMEKKDYRNAEGAIVDALSRAPPVQKQTEQRNAWDAWPVWWYVSHAP